VFIWMTIVISEVIKITKRQPVSVSEMLIEEFMEPPAVTWSGENCQLHGCLLLSHYYSSFRMLGFRCQVSGIRENAVTTKNSIHWRKYWGTKLQSISGAGGWTRNHLD
jgi:hypothetical protein